MKIERTVNAGRNIAFGMILQVYQIAIPFIMRTAMIYFLGVEYLGLNSLFSSVLQVLNLAELGVGAAMVYSMYKPIAEDDTAKICSLMKLYRTYYRVIGGVIGGTGLVLTPFIPLLVKSDLPEDINVYILYLMNLALTVLSYWLFAYKNSLFQAHQRIDIPNKVTLITNTIMYILQFFVLIYIKNYYVYVLISLFTQAMTNILTAIAATKMYPSYVPVGTLSKDEVSVINHRVRDLFTSKIGFVIVNSADTIVISAFLGLSMLAVYQNYYFILKSIINVIGIGFAACTAGIGNSLIVESREKNFNDLKKFTFLLCWITGVCSCCFLCLYQPFMKIWVGQDFMLEFSAVICFCIYFYVYEVNHLLNTYKDAGGIWHIDRFRTLATALSNLIMNLITVKFWGIYGVILSTVLSTLLVGMPWLFHNLFTTIFSFHKLKLYLFKLMQYVLSAVLACLLTYFVCTLFRFGEWATLLFRIAICCILPNIIFFFIFRRTEEFKECLILIRNVTKGRISFIKTSREN